MAKYQLKDFTYDGKYKTYCWNINYNPNATVQNGLANCTTMAYAFSLILNLPVPVSRIANASAWDRYLTNGWTCEDYGSCDIAVGDIVQWVAHCHVATVIGFKNGEPLLGCSWYTGEHGKSMYDGSFDTRNSIHTRQELSDFMSENYPYRFYHETVLSDEASRTGGLPEHILKHPSEFKPVEEDKSRDQIKVLTNEQNVRNGDLEVVGTALGGFYNVYSKMEANGYLWYEIEPNRYIAQVDGRVIYIPREDDYAELLKAMKEIYEIAKRWV